MIASQRPRSAPAIWLVAALLLLAGLSLDARARAADVVLEGRYEGRGAAAGAVLEIRPDPGGFTGRFRDAAGTARDFLADRRGDLALAVIDLDGGTFLMQAAPLPFGAEVALVPLTEEGPRPERGRVLSLLAPGVGQPRWPEGYAPAPEAVGAALGASSFLVSYRWWKPGGVARGYMALAPRHRTLMRLFPAVQLDVLWKVCLAAPGAAGVARAQATALRGQPLSCAGAVDGLARVQRAGRYPAFREEVARRKAILRTQARCADNYVMPAGACRRVAERVAEAAISQETTATVLERHDRGG